MTTAYSSLLGLALPVQGELAGQWGDTVNDYITKYLDASIAGSLSITADVTLTKTTGTTLGATSSQYAILTCSPSSVNIVVTAPAAYKIYVVNNTSASYTVTIRGATPTSGVVLAALEKAVVAWNGSDFFKVATSATDGVSTFSAGSTGLTPNSATSGAVTLAGTLAVANGGTGLTAGTSGGVLAYTAAGTLASSSALAASALVIGGGAGAAPSTTTTGTGVVTALGVNTGSAGAFVVNGGALGTPASGTVTNLTGTASININGTVGATTATTGAFTTVSATTSIITKKNGSDTVGSGGALGLANAAEDREWLLQLSGSNELWYWAYDSTASPAWVNPGRMTRTGLNSTVIGATTPAAGSFTTLSTTGAVGLTLAADTAVRSTGNIYYDAGTSGTGNHIFRQGSGYETRITINGTGAAVTGTLSASGAATFQNVSATIGNGSGVGNSGAKLIMNGWNTAGANWQIDAAVLTNANELGFTPSTVAGGLTFTTPVVIMRTTGLAVTGTLSATGSISTSDTTDATSTTAASLKTAGGLAVVKQAYFGGSVVAPNLVSYKGATGTLANGTPATILSFTSKSQGLYTVFANLPAGAGTPSSYASYADVLWDGVAARIVTNNGSLLLISLSGTDIQVQQNSGGSYSINWAIQSVNVA